MDTYATFTLGCVWSPVQIRPPTNDESFLFKGFASQR